jgi:hypothetical protein
MDKRYQVFVSSTYTDLLEARAEVMQALLELDCMPAGMELFPAANEEQWAWITRVIDESDYYIVILAGRYGSISKQTGLSYTEMEYRYAIETNKPVIAFVHENPAKLLAEDSEPTEDGRAKLTTFRDLVQTRLCKQWSTPADLGAKVSRSITQLIKQHPAVGWIRANTLSNESAQETLALRRQVEELQAKLKQVAVSGPPNIDALAQGDDKYVIDFVVDKKEKRIVNDRTFWGKASEHDEHLEMAWDEIFGYLAPTLIDPKEDHVVYNTLVRKVDALALPRLERVFPESKFERLRLYHDSYERIKIQLRALGLIAISQGKWQLTEYGDAHMNRLLAVPRPSGKLPSRKKRRPR